MSALTRALMHTGVALLAAFLVAELALWLRGELIHSEAVQLYCASAESGFWCEVRREFLASIVDNVFGWVCVGAAVLARSLRSTVLAGLALVSGMVSGLSQHLFPACVGLVLAFWVLVRLSLEHHQREQRRRA